MEKTLGRKIQLDKVTIDIVNAEVLIKKKEEDISYIQNDIKKINSEVEVMETLKTNLERQINSEDKPKVEKPVEKTPEPVVKRRRTRRTRSEQ